MVIKSSFAMLPVYSRTAIEDWIPFYCLSINSCLNPLVHAFIIRNDKFKNALKQKCALVECNSGIVAPAGQTTPSGGVTR